MPGESLDSIAERLERAADRFESTGSTAGAEAGRAAAARVRAAPSVDAGLAIEQEFMLGYAAAAAAGQSPRSWWWWLTHPTSWFSSADDFDSYSDDS